MISDRRSKTPPHPNTCHATFVYGRQKCLELIEHTNPDAHVPSSAEFYWNRAYAASWEAVATSLDAPAAKDGSPLKWNLAKPCLLIQHVLKESPELQECYAEALRDDPCSADRPWKVVIGFDEFVPGKFQHGEQPKKMMCLYFNFLNLGQHIIAQGSSWWVPVVVRHDFCKQVDGGWSCMLAMFCRELFLSTEGLLTSGVPVIINNSYVLLHGDLYIMMSDGEGLQRGYCWKGASSLKPCIRHYNVLMKGSDLATRCANNVEITCDDPTKFKVATMVDYKRDMEALAEAFRIWKAGGMTKELYESIEKAAGFTFHSRGLPWALSPDELDVWTPIRKDWVHTALQDGAMSKEMHLMVDATGSASPSWGYPAVQGCRISLEIYVTSNWMPVGSTASSPAPASSQP